MQVTAATRPRLANRTDCSSVAPQWLQRFRGGKWVV
jgi:hypothetical protein